MKLKPLARHASGLDGMPCRGPAMARARYTRGLAMFIDPRRTTRASVRPLPQTDVNNIALAIADLKGVRARLRFAGAYRAADSVARAIKSAEGALRHARGKLDRSR